MGLDLSSKDIWTSYIRFLQTAPEIPDADKVASIRKVYHRALLLPIANLETLFSEYKQWEHKLNVAFAEATIKELMPKHQHAKICAAERKKRFMLARPPGLQRSACPPSEKHQARDFDHIRQWRECISYEQKNPQHLERPALKARVVFAFKQALLTLRHYPDLWLEYAGWCTENSYPEDAEKIMDEAVEAMPSSLLMQLMRAQQLESLGDFEQALAVYKNLIDAQEHLDSGADPLAYVQYMRFARRCLGITAARRVFVQARRSKGVSHITYCAAALLEDRVNKDNKMAAKIYAYGLELYSGKFQFIQQYLDFLSSSHDHNNMRVVFERVFKEGTIDPAELRTLWEQFVDFEREQGDIKTITQVEERRRTAAGFADGNLGNIAVYQVNDLVDRLRYFDQWPCSPSYRAYLEVHLIPFLAIISTCICFILFSKLSPLQNLTPHPCAKLVMNICLSL
jgi:cleavage stimulation factor subunit 3